MPSEGIEGDEWDAYVTLDTYDRDERGINPWGRVPRGDGVPVVVSGVTTRSIWRPEEPDHRAKGHRR